MATFSTNQARQLYVAEALKPSNVISTDAVGSIAVKSDTAKITCILNTWELEVC